MDSSQIKKAAGELSAQAVRFRRAIHARPELSFAEHETSRYVADRLREAGIPFVPVAGHRSCFLEILYKTFIS